MKRINGSIVVSLLWVVAILSIVVVGSLYSVQMEVRVVKNYTDSVKARYLARAGVEKAKALLYQQAVHRQQNHSGTLYDAPGRFRDVEFGSGMFRVFRHGGRSEGGGIVYGVKDEERRLNINHASAKQLARLPNMSPQTAAAIVDYRDSDDNISPGGAEFESYTQQQPPYLPRNGPFRTARELLSVYNIPRQRFLGEDHNQNGLLDPEENDGSDSPPSDDQDSILDAGWSGMVTATSGITNVNFSGKPRINIQSADKDALSGVDGISTDLANAIVEYRQDEELKNLADLLNVREMEETNRPQGSGQGDRSGGRPGRRPQRGQQGSSQSSSQPTGQALIDQSHLIDIADELTASDSEMRRGVVNINTATVDVLECLPGIDAKRAQSIVDYRSSRGFFRNVAAVLNVSNIDEEVFEKVSSHISARSETFRIVSEGKVGSGEASRERIEVIVQVRRNSVITLSYREGL